MDLRMLRQTLKALSDDSRLRIVSLLSGNQRELIVKDICTGLAINQPAISKHLIRLRLLEIVRDRRCGNFIYYSLNCDSERGKVVMPFIAKFKNLETFKRDLGRLNKSKTRSNKVTSENKN